MAIILTDDQHYKNIAAAIRKKANTDATFKPAEMAAGVGEVYEAGYEEGYEDGKGEGGLSVSAEVVDDVLVLSPSVSAEVVDNVLVISRKEVKQ